MTALDIPDIVTILIAAAILPLSYIALRIARDRLVADPEGADAWLAQVYEVAPGLRGHPAWQPLGHRPGAHRLDQAPGTRAQREHWAISTAEWPELVDQGPQGRRLRQDWRDVGAPLASEVFAARRAARRAARVGDTELLAPASVAGVVR